jgi:hypothetical protein
VVFERAMSFSDELRSGFALAATIAKDAGAAKARLGLAAESLEALTATARELAGLPKAERRARVRALMSPSALPTLALTSRAELAPRALALLQPGSGQPLPRPGYAPEPRLLALLQRIAAGSGLARGVCEGAWRA